MGVHHNRHSGIHLAGFLAVGLSTPGRAPATVEHRTRVHPVRPGRASDPNSLGATRSASSDVGVCYWQVHDRSDLVGLSFLDAKISEYELWLEDHSDRFAAGSYLRRG